MTTATATPFVNTPFGVGVIEASDGHPVVADYFVRFEDDERRWVWAEECENDAVKAALDTLPEEARKAIETLGLDDEQGMPIASLILQGVGVAGLCAWVAYQEVLESGSVDAFDMGEILAAALPALERTIRSDERSEAAKRVKAVAPNIPATDSDDDLIRRGLAIAFLLDDSYTVGSAEAEQVEDTDDPCTCGHVRHEHRYFPDPECGPETGSCAHCDCERFELAVSEVIPS